MMLQKNIIQNQAEKEDNLERSTFNNPKIVWKTYFHFGNIYPNFTKSQKYCH